MKEPFVLYPAGQYLPEEIEALIPSDLPRKAIVGVAVGPTSLLNLYARKKIEAYFGSSQKLLVRHGAKHRDALIFIREKDLGNYTINQTEMEL